jgi:hypothetical protein
MRVLILSNIFVVISSFTIPPKAFRVYESLHLRNSRPKSVLHRPILCSTREEEIAKLEAQIRQLKETNDATAAVEDILEKDDNNNNAAVPIILDPEDEKTLREFDAARRRLERVKGKDMLLTEQTLIRGGLLNEQNANGSGSSSGGIVSAIAVVVAAVVGLYVFSQIPIGQDDLARYSATGSSTIRSIDLGDLNPDASRL